MDEALKNAKDYDPSDKLWLQEYPQTFRSRSNCFRYYKIQNTLAISKADFIDAKTGNIRMGKTVLIQLADLTEVPDVLDALIEILQSARESVGK